MTNKTDPDQPNLKDLFLDHIGSLVLAFAVSFVALKLLSALGLAPHVSLAINMIVFFTILHVDPIAAVREGKSKREMWAKLAVGLGIAVILAIPFAFDLFSFSPAETGAEALAIESEKPERGLFSTIWPVLFGLLILPLLFMAPLAEKALKKDDEGKGVTAEDMQISATFPAYIMISMSLNLAVPGAIWLLGLSLWIAALIMLASILICVAEIWTAEPEDLAQDIDNSQWGPRAETAQEAWAGFRKAVRQSFSSAVFLGSVIYISLMMAMPFMGDGSIADTNPLRFIMGFLAMSGVMLVSTLMLFALGVIVLAGVTYILGRSQGADPLTVVELAKQAQMRLLGGGMQWVRPDLESD